MYTEIKMVLRCYRPPTLLSNNILYKTYSDIVTLMYSIKFEFSIQKIYIRDSKKPNSSCI